MRLSIEKRARLVTLYLKHDLSYVKNRYGVLRNIALREDIVASEKTIGKIIKNWYQEGIRLLSNYY